MALEYEVRPEYRSRTLEELLDLPVDIFQGVGDLQREVLNNFFAIRTVRQLANMPFFLWSLGIQELVFLTGEGASKPVAELAGKMALKFSLKEEYNSRTPRQLLDAPAHVMEGLTPAQDLALYDGFRITTVLQLAHNRIMLEARVIEYLATHKGSRHVGGSDGEIASILLADAVIPDLALAQKRLSGEDEALSQMTKDLSSHIRGRIEALTERDAKAGGKSSVGDLLASRQRDSKGRMETILKSREQAGKRDSLIAESRQSILSGPKSAAGPVKPSATPSGGEVQPPGDGAAGQAARAGQPGVGAQGTGAGAGRGAVSGKAVPGGAAPAKQGANVAPWVGAAAVVALAVGVGLWATQPGQENGGEEGANSQSGMEGGGAPAGDQPGRAGLAGKEPVKKPGQTAESGQKRPAGGKPVGSQPAGDKGVYQVVPGDSLWKISGHHLDDPEKWPTIYKRNENKIKDPDLIYPKQEFKIPDGE